MNLKKILALTTLLFLPTSCSKHQDYPLPETQPIPYEKIENPDMEWPGQIEDGVFQYSPREQDIITVCYPIEKVA